MRMFTRPLMQAMAPYLFALHARRAFLADLCCPAVFRLASHYPLSLVQQGLGLGRLGKGGRCGPEDPVNSWEHRSLVDGVARGFIVERWILPLGAVPFNSFMTRFGDWVKKGS